MLPVAAASLHSFFSVLRIRYMSEGSREAILFCVIVNQRLLSLRFQTPFKTKKDVIEVLLMSEVPLTQLTQHPELDDLFCGTVPLYSVALGPALRPVYSLR